jgi:hypothetical protein
MRTHTTKRPLGCHGLLELPLFAWANRGLPPLTTGGAWLHRRYRLPRELAEVIAELAGIGPERRR